MRALRRELAAACPEAGERAAAHLPAEVAAGAGVFGLYHPSGSELDPTPLRARLPKGAVALPVAQARVGPLVFRLHSPGDAMVPDALGIPSPGPQAQT